MIWIAEPVTARALASLITMMSAFGIRAGSRVAAVSAFRCFRRMISVEIRFSGRSTSCRYLANNSWILLPAVTINPFCSRKGRTLFRGKWGGRFSMTYSTAVCFSW